MIARFGGRCFPCATAGAAPAVCAERTDLLRFVTFDDRLAEAARREGFEVLTAPG